MAETEMEVESRDKENGGHMVLRAWRMVGPHTVPVTHIISLNVINSLAERDYSYFMDEKTEVHSSEVLRMSSCSWEMGEPRFHRQ